MARSVLIVDDDAADGFALAEQLVALPWPVRVVLISSDSDSANATAAELAGVEFRRWIES